MGRGTAIGPSGRCLGWGTGIGPSGRCVGRGTGNSPWSSSERRACGTGPGSVPPDKAPRPLPGRSVRARSRAAPPRRHRPSRRRCGLRGPRGPCQGTLRGDRGRRPPRTSLCGAGGDCRGRGARPALASLPPAAERLPARLSGGCGHCGPRTSAGLFSSRLPCGPPRLRLEHPPPPPPPLSPSPPPPAAPPPPPRS